MEDEGYKDLSEITEDDGSLTVDRGHEYHEYDEEIGSVVKKKEGEEGKTSPGHDRLWQDLEQGLTYDESIIIFGRMSSQEEESLVQRSTQNELEEEQLLQEQQDRAIAASEDVQDTEATGSEDSATREIHGDSQHSSSGEPSSGRVVSSVGDVISDISDEGSLLVGLATAGEVVGATASSVGANSEIESQEGVSSTNALANSREQSHDIESLTGCTPQLNHGTGNALEQAGSISNHAAGYNRSALSSESNDPPPRPAARTIATQTDMGDSEPWQSSNSISVEKKGTEKHSRLELKGGSLYDMMMDNSILSDMDQNQHKSTERAHPIKFDDKYSPDKKNQISPGKSLEIIDMDTGLDISQHSDGSGMKAVVPEPRKHKRKKRPKPLKMGREQRHKRKATEIKHPRKLAELPFVDARMDLSENSRAKDGMEFLDSRSRLSDEETGLGDAMEWSGTVPWGLDDEVCPTTQQKTSSAELTEQRLKTASFVLYHVTTHWPQLIAILHWEKSPSFLAAPLIFGLVAVRWCGRQQHHRPMLNAVTAAVGYVLIASASSVHDSLVFVGLLLASVHEPIILTNATLRQVCVVVSYLIGGIIYERLGKVGLGAFGGFLLAINAALFHAVERSEMSRMIASESTSRLSIVASNENLPTILEDEERTTFASVIQTCSVSAVHGLITTTIPWLVAFEYGWTNVMFLCCLFAGSVAAVPVVPLLLASRFATYALTYAALLTGMPYKWPFLIGFLLLPSCMKAAPSSPLVESAAFLAYLLAAVSSPLLFIVMPHAPAVVGCCIAFIASVVGFRAKSNRKADTSDSYPQTSLHALQKTLF